jgi:MFS transporter, DHA2 family, multidrug resistance protein
LGPVAGGWITDTYSWHWIFLVNVPVGLLTFFSVMHLLEDSPRVAREKRTAPPFDYIGTGFIALALGCLEIATDRGEDYDWLGSQFIQIMFLLSAIGFLFGIVYLYYARHPIVDLRVYADRNFTLGSLQIAIMGLVLYASAVLIPEFAQEQLGYTATWAGLVLAPGAVVLVMLIPVVSRVLGWVPGKYVIAFGGFALGAALLYSRNIVPDLDFYHLMLLRGAQTAGLAFLFVPISTIAYATLPQSLNGDATALFNMARNVFGGIGISISSAIVTSYQQVNQQSVIANLTPTNQPYQVLLQRIEQALVNTGHSFAQAVKMAPGQVVGEIQTQVAVLSYMDVFFITACMAFVMVPTALLMSGGKPQSSGAGMH